ncbi:MAG: hypothetical protein GTO14_07720 [Anaerolineales bacterium]|nr:hypothetical protein [Anaerolineales bacterium]
MMHASGWERALGLQGGKAVAPTLLVHSTYDVDFETELRHRETQEARRLPGFFLAFLGENGTR